jgi:hypothetical protein
MQNNGMMRRFHHGLGGQGVFEEEVYDLIKGTMVALGISSTPEDVDFDLWRTRMTELCRDDPRWKRIEERSEALYPMQKN